MQTDFIARIFSNSKNIYVLRICCDRFDVIFLHETHDNTVADLVQIYKVVLRQFWIFSSLGTAAGGCIILVTLRIMETCSAWRHFNYEKGRIQLLTLAAKDGNIDLLNIHSCPNLSLGVRCAQLRYAWSLFRISYFSLRVAGGDFNCCLCLTDRMRVANGEFSGVTNIVSDTLNSLVADFITHDNLEYSRRHMGRNGVLTYSINDQFFLDLPLEAYATCNFNVGCIGNVAGRDFCSDHWPSCFFR